MADINELPVGFTGCLPRPCKVGENPRFKVWGTVDDCPTIPRSEWVNCSLRHKVWEIVNQKSQSSCAAASTRGAVELLREVNGMKRIPLSHGSLYGQANNQRDSGANVMDILEAMMDVGIAPASIVDPYDWTPRDYPTDWKVHAAKYRILEAWDCPSWDEMISAIQKSYPVVYGINWPGGGGHAIVGIGYQDGKVETLNSWGADWGDGGIGYITESQARAITSYGAFCLRSVTIPSDETLPPAPK